MNTKLIVVMGAVLALAGVASAYDSSRVVVSPGTVNLAAVGTVGVAVCERVTPALGGSPIQCEDTGFSAFFDDVGCSANGVIAASPHTTGPYTLDDCAAAVDGDGVDNFVTGHCSASATFTPTTTTPQFTIDCGNDRDDDTFVTNADTSGTSDTSREGATGACSDANGIVAGCYDDEFVSSNGANTAFCFTLDRATVDDPTSNAFADSAGSDYDGFVVFVGVNVPNANGAIGTVTVDLDASSSGTSCTRSAHADSNYFA